MDATTFLAVKIVILFHFEFCTVETVSVQFVFLPGNLNQPDAVKIVVLFSSILNFAKLQHLILLEHLPEDLNQQDGRQNAYTKLEIQGKCFAILFVHSFVIFA